MLQLIGTRAKLFLNYLCKFKQHAENVENYRSCVGTSPALLPNQWPNNRHKINRYVPEVRFPNHRDTLMDFGLIFMGPESIYPCSIRMSSGLPIHSPCPCTPNIVFNAQKDSSCVLRTSPGRLATSPSYPMPPQCLYTTSRARAHPLSNGADVQSITIPTRI